MKKTLKRLAPDPGVVELQNLLTANGYFRDKIPQHGLFEEITHETVILFQVQHVDQDGHPLAPDGVVGKKTWWALTHPSGEDQRNHFTPIIPQGLTRLRHLLLDLLIREHAKPVAEAPDGSNRSREIDRYWGNTGIIGQPWCCAFVSWALHDLLGRYPIGGRHHVGVQQMWRTARLRGMAEDAPKPGDIFIQIKAGGCGHTGFVIGVTADGQSVYTCEGNCGNRLKIGLRQKSSIDYYIDCLRDGQDPDFSPSTFDAASVDHRGTR